MLGWGKNWGTGLEEIPRPIQDSGNILKQGYLEKRSREPSFFGSEWHKRWCVLTQRNFLYYTNEKKFSGHSPFLEFSSCVPQFHSVDKPP
uniref:PH domain-containing protein n=1 Tax=Chloebia gouldiae TaxID=44316 RepID=A0A3L8QWC3_CHLGU|nr:hypothetical protein DV515_00017309 [Chloebia gouldiae]